MSIIRPDEAQRLRERVVTQERGLLSLQEKEDILPRLVETILALWPFVEAWEIQPCTYGGIKYGGDNPGRCNCWSCQARRLLQKEKA